MNLADARAWGATIGVVCATGEVPALAATPIATGKANFRRNYFDPKKRPYGLFSPLRF